MVPAYWWIVRTLRRDYPELLLSIDPHGFRAMLMTSQLRFTAFLFTRRYARQVSIGFRRFLDAYLAASLVYVVGFSLCTYWWFHRV
jgi:hypothetical protein